MTLPAKHTLLVVDDEQGVCDSVHDLLRREMNVIKARNAEEAYRSLRENAVHVIMTDQRMPKVTGVEMLADVRVRHPHAIRILFTGYADVEAVIAAINQGRVFRFLRKPWQPEEIEGAVREAIAEYDRLVEQAEHTERMRAEMAELRARVTALEGEVRGTHAG
jgi:DNA-binding NtrC family response regulator